MIMHISLYFIIYILVDHSTKLESFFLCAGGSAGRWRRFRRIPIARLRTGQGRGVHRRLGVRLQTLLPHHPRPAGHHVGGQRGVAIHHAGRR